MEGVELAPSFPLSSFFVQPIDRRPILVTVRQCDELRWSMRMFFGLRDIIGFFLIVVLPVGEQRMVLVTAMGGSENGVPHSPPNAHLDITTQFNAIPRGLLSPVRYRLSMSKISYTRRAPVLGVPKGRDG